MRKITKCPLCFGTGEFKSNADEGWPAFMKHNPSYMEGFQNGYDKCSQDDRMAILSKAMRVAEPYQKQLYNFFIKFNGDKGDKAKNEESARFMADIICIELGLNKRTKPSKK